MPMYRVNTTDPDEWVEYLSDPDLLFDVLTEHDIGMMATKIRELFREEYTKYGPLVAIYNLSFLRP